MFEPHAVTRPRDVSKQCLYELYWTSSTSTKVPKHNRIEIPEHVRDTAAWLR